MNQRIKLIREHYGLSQAKFAEQLNAATTTIASYEAGYRTPKPMIVKAICEVFGVNEDWLRNGNGEMLMPVSTDNDMQKIINEATESPLIRSILTTWVRLSAAERAAFENIVDKMIDDYNGGPNATQRFINEHLVKQDTETEEQAQ